MEVVILIPKETSNTCNFPGGGGGGAGPDLLTPTSLWIQKSRESVETIVTPKYTVVQQLQGDITNSVMFCSGQNSSNKRTITSNLCKIELWIFVDCISPN